MMKKIVSVLLCLLMLSSLISCSNDEIKDHENNDTHSDTAAESSDEKAVADYSGILNIYRHIIEILPTYVASKDTMDHYCTELGIVDEEEKDIFKKLFDSTFDFKQSQPYKLSCGYAQKDLNGDGVDELVLMNKDYDIIAIFSFANGKPVLLGNYWVRNSCWIDGDGLLHINGSNGADHSTNALYKIAVGGERLDPVTELGTNGHEWIDDVAYTKYYKVVDGEKVSITESEYTVLDEQYGNHFGTSGAETTRQYSGLTFTFLYTEAEIAMEAYKAVLNNDIRIYETDIEEYNYLADCKTPYRQIPLRECENLGYAYTDLDDDSINELVIDCGDTLLLRYYEGTVYLYPFTFRSQLQTDGSYSWSHTGQDVEYGENKLYFEGAKLESKELWRIVNDGEPTVGYYIDGKQVAKEEILRYIEENPKTNIEFSRLHVSWQIKISESEAISIAKNYWKKFDPEGNGYIIGIAVSSRAPSSVYVLTMKWLVIDHYSTIDEIWVDKSTGETIIPYLYTEEITRDKALEIASNYWGIEDGFEDHATGTKYIARIVLTNETDEYYHVAWQFDVYHRNDDGNYVFASTQTYKKARIDRNMGTCINLHIYTDGK